MENNDQKTSVPNPVKEPVIKTYAEDLASVLEGGGGMIKDIIHEEEANEEEKQQLSPQTKRNQLFMILGIVLLFISLAVFSFFLWNKQEITTTPVVEQFTPLIFTDKNVFIEVLGLEKGIVEDKVLNEVRTGVVKEGGVEGIYLLENDKFIGLRHFMELVKLNFTFPSPIGEVDLVKDNFSMGFVNTKTEDLLLSSKDFFILIKVRSTADVFNNLRTWEEKMFVDLRKFFGVNLSSDNSYLLTKDFEDGIVGNKNARILYSLDSKIVLMYIFADDNSVIITNSREATGELMLRLAGSKK